MSTKPSLVQITIFEIINRALARTADPSIEPLPDAGRWLTASRLMYAAPKLLASLKAMTADMRDAMANWTEGHDRCGAECVYCRNLRAARAAIAEADGAEAMTGGTFTGVAGEKLDPGDAVYRGEDGKMYKFKGDSE